MAGQYGGLWTTARAVAAGCCVAALPCLLLTPSMQLPLRRRSPPAGPWQHVNTQAETHLLLLLLMLSFCRLWKCPVMSLLI